MSDSAKAVFLSYAREDTSAAKHIADALRAFGVEVWFDQSELRGGDAWDTKIRNQIKTCALFVPIISGRTEERTEGYFRREWKLAVDRTHDMAGGKSFIVPIVIDETKEGEAAVPEEFMRYQWTRLVNGEATPEFVTQVKRLLSKEQGAGSKETGHRSAAAVSPKYSPPKQSGLPGWTWGALAAVVAAVAAAFFVLHKPEPTAVVPTPPVAEARPAAVVAPLVRDKSIAVLPFTNMSEDKANAFFADGIHEDILTNLALIRELRVVSRTSVMPYRTTTKSMKQIAQELGVTYILEGSVQRSGNKVRVTGQLIHAATDEHVWAQAYDRDLTDIFSIQSELSQQIAAALKAALSPEEKVLLARKPTENPAAYDLFLRARDVQNREGNTPAALTRKMLLLQSAVDLDPAFAQGWGELAAACAFSYFSNMEGMDTLLSRAKAAMERAMQLAPDDPDVFSSLGTFKYYAYRDYSGATEQFERLARLQPNSPSAFSSLGLIQRRQGHWAESLVNSRRASELDPANLSYQRILLTTLLAARRWDEALAAQRRIVTLLPDNPYEAYMLANYHFLATGSTKEAEAFFAKFTPEQLNSPLGLNLRQSWAATSGDFAEVVRLDKIQPYYEEDGLPHFMQAFFAAYANYALGDKPAVKARLGDFPSELRAQLVKEPQNGLYWSILGGMEAILGHKEEALRCTERTVELLPESRDALDGVSFAAYRAQVNDLVGDKEKALAEYTRLLRVPTTQAMNVHELRHNIGTLHGDPRYEALLNDPANNSPLF